MRSHGLVAMTILLMAVLVLPMSWVLASPATQGTVPTPTPNADGYIIHIVQSGDTLSTIAYQYGIDIEVIRQLNNMTDDTVFLDQPLIIGIVTPTPTPTPVTPTPTPTPSLEMTGICVLSFYDHNRDGIRQADSEELLAGTMVTLVGTSGPVGSYTIEDVSKPFCVQGLSADKYVVYHVAPEGYVKTGPETWGLVLGAGQTYNVELGYVPQAEAPSAQQTPGPGTPAPQPTRDAGAQLTLIVTIIGWVFLLLAIGILAFAFLSRRQRL